MAAPPWEAAKVMRWVDPSIELAACGSSNHRDMATYARWEYEVLDHCFDHVDFISLHTYFMNPHDSTEEFLGNIELLDYFIKEVVAIADAVAATRRSQKRIMLSLDEWSPSGTRRAATTISGSPVGRSIRR